jgi:hypothetical protein
MELLPKPPTIEGPAELFTGDVYFDVVIRGEGPSRVRVNTVRFRRARARPGIRTPSARRCR